jgi:Flp pilus assembly protein TadG
MHIRFNLRQKLISRLQRPSGDKAQSFLELALILPILILMLLGIAEVAMFMGRYLDVLDLSREAARLASLNDPTVAIASPSFNCSALDAESINYYYRAACVFSPPSDATCTDSNFCNGFNRYINFDLDIDDVVVSGYTVTGNTVSDTWPSSGVWSLSKDGRGASVANWTKDCKGTVVGGSPYYTSTRINSLMQSATDKMSTAAILTPSLTYDPAKSKGFVAVEVFYCYHQILGIPVLTQFIPNPVRIHAYTLMPLPAVQPTLTPLP